MSEQTAEQEARDMLERIGVQDAQSFSSGDVVELANLLARRSTFSQADVAALHEMAVVLDTESFHELAEAAQSIARRIALVQP